MALPALTNFRLKQFLNRARDFLKVNRKDLVVFLLSFLLAFSIWFIHNVSLRYSEILTATVSAESNISGRRRRAVGNCKVVARCRATGYSIMRNKMFGGATVRIELDASSLRHREGDVFAFSPESMPEFGKMVFGGSVSAVEYYLTDTLLFVFPEENSRKVPVVPISDIWYAQQYMSVKGMEVKPDSVYVYGDPSKIDGVSKVFTRSVTLADLSSDAHGSVDIEPINGVRISETSVDYTVIVRRYVSEEVSFPVRVRNVPPGKSLAVYPSRVNAVVACQFPLMVEPESLDVMYVDYRDFEQSRSGKCVVQIDALPDGVLGVRPETDVVTCVAR